MQDSETLDPAALFERYNEALCRYLYRFTGDAEVAADVVQETFVRFLQNTPNAEWPRAWLFRVATNLALDYARKTRRRRLLLLGAGNRLPHGDPPRGTDEQLQADLRRRVVSRALQELSEKERMALLMREEGFAQREIAEAVGTTTGSVGTLTARAIRKLAARLASDQEGV